MVFQIYYSKDGMYNRQVLFDIEFYLAEDEVRNLVNHREDCWYVEIHSSRFISNAVDYILSKTKDDEFNVDEFKKDCHELEELRGWLWEHHHNIPRTIDDASKFKDSLYDELRSKIHSFADKYGLYVNED